MKRLAILGASGHGKVIAEIAEFNGFEEITFFDDARDVIGTLNGSWPVVGRIEDFMVSSALYDGVIVAIGNNEIRCNIYDDLFFHKISVVTLIHPAAVVSRYAKIGIGSVVVAGAVVNAYATIGRGAIINTNASIDHDCHLGDYVHISPGGCLAGGVTVEDKSWIGIGACVKQQVAIGARVTVGAGAVVINDISDGLTVAGVPARPL